MGATERGETAKEWNGAVKRRARRMTQDGTHRRESRPEPTLRWVWAHRLAAAVVLGLGIAVLSGCGTPPAGSTTPTGTVSVPIQPTVTPLDTAWPTMDPSAAGAGGSFDASDQLTTTSCAAIDGVWSYDGTMANPTSTEQTFTVAITLVQTSDMSAAYTKEIEVTVPAGESAPVTAPDFHTDQAKGLECLTGATVKGG